MAVVIDDGNNRLAAVMQFIQQQQQKRAEAERMRVQQEQFDRSFGLQERQVNSVVNANDDAVQRANAEAAVKNMMPRLQKFSAEGNYRAAEAEAASLLKAYEGSPYFEAIRHQVLPFVTPQQSAAMADTSASNVAKYTMDQTGLAAGGSEDAQAVNFTTKLATGEQLNAPAFGNQEQREFGPDALKSYVDIGAGRTANAGQRLAAATQLQANREQIASNERIAGAQLGAMGRGATAGTDPGSRPPREDRIIESIDKLIPQVSNWTTGPGVLLSKVPGTEARAYAAELDTLKANIAFGELQAMREASKTGGALGNVSDRETALLSATLGALDQGVDPETAKKHLQTIRDSLTRWNFAKRMYGAGGQGGNVITATNPQTGQRIQSSDGGQTWQEVQ